MSSPTGIYSSHRLVIPLLRLKKSHSQTELTHLMYERMVENLLTIGCEKCDNFEKEEVSFALLDAGRMLGTS